ncbi:MAG: hypothetical protein FWC21_06800 [Treponema sp.]|nr:hypothetical protein [Treponema sp.]
MNLSRQYSFWGSLSPLGGLSGVSLLVMASARLSWAIVVAGCLFWVYGLTTLAYAFLMTSFGNRFFPVQGKVPLFTCFASFFGGIYILLLWLICPFAALEILLPLLLVPLLCASSGVVQIIDAPEIKKAAEAAKPSLHSIDTMEHIANAVSQAISLSILLISFSIIREPVSYSMLSFPGSNHGIMTIMYLRENTFFPIGIFSQSAGALVLLGYVMCLYQYGKSKLFPGEKI